MFELDPALIDRKYFVGGGKLFCLDASYSILDSSKVVDRHDDIEEAEIEQWMKKEPDHLLKQHIRGQSVPSAAVPHLRLIVLAEPPHDESLEVLETPIRMTKGLFDLILDQFDLSPLFVTAALNQAAVHFKHCRSEGEDDTCLKFVFRSYSTPKARFCLALTYRPIDMRTTALLTGLRAPEIRSLFDAIEKKASLLPAPLFLPIALAEYTLRHLRDRLYHCHKITDSVKRRLGLATYVDKPIYKDPVIDDNIEMSQCLTTIFNKLGKYDNHGRHLLDLLHLFDEASQECLDATPVSQRGLMSIATASVRTIVAHMTSTMKSTHAWTEFLHRRAQGYVQAVYGLVSQRDTSLSIQLAKSSVEIASATRSDNAIMKALAEDSKLIAEDSRTVATESLRKSDAMRSIAVVTMLFLPATFIATLFSTSFFDFQPTDGGRVSKWIWLYALLTVVLTILIQGCWYLNVRLHRKKSAGPRHDQIMANACELHRAFEQNIEQQTSVP